MTVSVNQAFGNLLSMTMNAYSNELTDNIFEAFVLTHFLGIKNNVDIEGGVQIVEQVQVGKNETVKFHGATDTLTAATTIDSGVDAADGKDLTKAITKPPFGQTNQGEVTSLVFDWKELSGIVAYNSSEVAKNRGKHALLKLVKNRIDVLHESLKDIIERALIGGQINPASANNNFFVNDESIDGLRNVLTPLAAQATAGRNDANELHRYGGVPYNATAANIAWIQPYTHAGTGSAGLNMDDIETVITETDRGGTDTPDIGITSPKQWRNLAKAMRGQERHVNTEIADAGFKNILVDGLPFVYLSAGYCAATPTLESPWDEDWVAILNCKYLKFVKHASEWMENYGFQQVNRTPVWEALVHSMGQFFCTGRKYQGRITY